MAGLDTQWNPYSFSGTAPLAAGGGMGTGVVAKNPDTGGPGGATLGAIKPANPTVTASSTPAGQAGPTVDPVTAQIQAYLKLLNASDDPNDPNYDPQYAAYVKQLSQTAQNQTLTAARQRGIEGPLGVGNAERSIINARNADYMQRQGLAAQGLQTLSSNELGLGGLQLGQSQLAQQQAQFAQQMAWQRQQYEEGRQDAYNGYNSSGGPNWGAGLSGAATGAATGAAVGSVVPGIGTAAGAIGGGLIGGIGGLLAGSHGNAPPPSHLGGGL